MPLWFGANEQPMYKPKTPCWTATNASACSGLSTTSTTVT